MMCDKEILQLFCEDLNQSMSPLIISYHHKSSVTVSSSKTYEVCAGCLLPRNVFLDILTLKDGTKLLSQNIGTELTLNADCNPRSEQVSKHVQFQ
jgi:hypothetical protein